MWDLRTFIGHCNGNPKSQPSYFHFKRINPTVILIANQYRRKDRTGRLAESGEIIQSRNKDSLDQNSNNKGSEK
jgi:hypothetical protein